MVLRRAFLGLGVTIVLADGSIVTLALPQLLVDLHATVVGVAAVLFVYMAVLAGAVLLARGLQTRLGPRWLASGGFAVMLLACVICAVAGSLELMLCGRGLGAFGGGLAAVGAFELMDGGGRGRRAWLLASVVGLAVGPPLGGALTQAFGWRTIFVVQVPVAAIGALVARRWPEPGLPTSPMPPGDPYAVRRGPITATLALALGLVSAALSAVLFLLVLLLIAGWEVSPLRAALAVSVLPLAALLGTRVSGSPASRAVVGCALVGVGILALAWIPRAELVWTLLPQTLAGLGAGVALPALGGELLPQATAGQAARLLSVRHAAVALVLVALAPLISAQLQAGTRRAQLQGIALMLDAKLSPQEKIHLAPGLFAAVSSRQPRESLRAAFAAHRPEFAGSQLTTYDQLQMRSEDVLLGAVRSGFQSAFVITAVLALLAALLLAAPAARRCLPAPDPRTSDARLIGLGRRRASLARVLIGALLVPVIYLGAQRILAPAPVALANPCAGGSLPDSGGISGFLQDRGLQLLDDAACRLHTNREELLLALVSPAESERFAAAHDGVNPRSVLAPLLRLLGL